MASEFVRMIRGTKIKGDNKEPLDTNKQNDLLSDEEDIAIRNKEEYHCLTDNLKTDGLKNNNGFINITKTGKNSATIGGVKATKEEGLKGDDIDRIMNPKRVHELIDEKIKDLEIVGGTGIQKVLSENDYLKVENITGGVSLKTEQADYNQSISGNDDKVVMNPKNVKDAIEHYVPEMIKDIEVDIDIQGKVEGKIDNQPNGFIISNEETQSNWKLDGIKALEDHAEKGIVINNIMTPDLVKKAIDFQVPKIIEDNTVINSTEIKAKNEYIEVEKDENGIFSIGGQKASKEQAETGVDVDIIMNPLRVKQAIDSQVPSLIESVIEGMEIEGTIDIKPLNEYIYVTRNSKNSMNVGGVLASEIEGKTGVSVEKIMNPLRVKEAIDWQVPGIVREIISNTEIESNINIEAGNEALRVEKLKNGDFKLTPVLYPPSNPNVYDANRLITPSALTLFLQDTTFPAINDLSHNLRFLKKDDGKIMMIGSIFTSDLKANYKSIEVRFRLTNETGSLVNILVSGNSKPIGNLNKVDFNTELTNPSVKEEINKGLGILEITLLNSYNNTANKKSLPVDVIKCVTPPIVTEEITEEFYYKKDIEDIDMEHEQLIMEDLISQPILSESDKEE